MAAALAGCGASSSVQPNILFVIMDDVGIDQMKAFGYGGATAPSMPNIDAIAAAGIRFRNTWSMPECSPGRAAMFVGRYPLRTNIYAATGQNDLANSQVSPHDMTTPKLLKQVNYESGLFGKFHLAGPENNQAGNGTPAALGWDYFYGWVGGLAGSIDTSAGGVAAAGSYKCGYVPGAVHGGADAGACYQANGSCSNLSGLSAAGDVPGKQCLAGGGIFKPNAACQATLPAGLNFNKQNAYYVSPLVINGPAGVEAVALSDSRARGYRTTIEANAAIDWIKGRSSSRPWMATVSFTAPHTPLQQAPKNLISSAVGAGEGLDCSSSTDWRVLQNQVTEAMDAELGRLLVETRLATRNPDGTLAYNPKAGNTMIVIVGDNGTLGNTVKAPFNLQRAKGTAYQTGVWVPLIVAGPLVAQPNRDVEHMVNMVDVYQLFGEMAGIDVPGAVPRTIDSAPLLPYLSKVDQSSIRTLNFTQGGYNIQANEGRNGPCVISQSSCSQIPVSKSVCEDNGGVWWGRGYDDVSVVPPSASNGGYGYSSGAGYPSCCQVQRAYTKSGSATQLSILPEVVTAVRNDAYKLVQNSVQTYTAAGDSCTSEIKKEFYAVDQKAPSPALDNAGLDLLPSQASWSSALTAIYNHLLAQLNTILASQPACAGDGNLDRAVNAQDLVNWQMISQAWGYSSVYDFNFDGVTDNADLQIINQNTGDCARSTAVY